MKKKNDNLSNFEIQIGIYSFFFKFQKQNDLHFSW